MWFRISLLLLFLTFSWVECQAEKDSSTPIVNAPIIIQAKSKVYRANDFKKKLMDDLSTKKPLKMFGLPPEFQNMFTNEFMSSRGSSKSTMEQSSTSSEPSQQTPLWSNYESTTEQLPMSSMTRKEDESIETSSQSATESSSLWTAFFSLIQEPTTKIGEFPSSADTEEPLPSTMRPIPLGNFKKFLHTLEALDTETSSKMADSSTDVTSEYHEHTTGAESAGEVEHHARFARQVTFQNFTEADVAFPQDNEEDEDVEFVDEEDAEEMEPEEEEVETKPKEKVKPIPESRNMEPKPPNKPFPFPIDITRLVNMKDDKVVNFQPDTLPMPNPAMNKDAAMLAKVPLYFQGAGSQLSREQPLFLTPMMPNLPFPSNNPLDLYTLLAMVLKNQIPSNNTLPVPNLLLPNVPIVNYSKPTPVKKTEETNTQTLPIRNDTDTHVNPLNTFYGKSYKPGKVVPDLKTTGKDDSKELFPAESSPEKVSAKKPEDTDYEYEYVYYYYDEDDPNNKTTVVKPAAKPKPDLKKPPSAEKPLNLPIKDDVLPLITPLPHNTVAAEGRAIPAANIGKSSLLENPLPTKPKLGSEFDTFPTSAPLPIKPVTSPPQLLSTPLAQSKKSSHPFMPGPDSPVLFLGIQKESMLPEPPHLSNLDEPTKDPENLVSLYAFSKALDSTTGDGPLLFSSRPPGTPPGFQTYPSDSDSQDPVNKKKFNIPDALFSHPVFDPIANATDDFEEAATTQNVREPPRPRPALPGFRGDKDFGGKPSASKTTTPTTTTTEEAKQIITTKAPKPVRGRRPTFSRTTTTTTAATASGGASTSKPVRVTRPSRKNSRTRNKETTTTPASDDVDKPATEKPTRGGSRTNNRKSSKSRSTTTTTTTEKSTTERKNSRRNKPSNRSSRNKSRTTTTSTTTAASTNNDNNSPTTTEGNHKPAGALSAKRKSNLFPRRRVPTSSTTAAPEAEVVEEKPEDSENEASAKTTTPKPTTLKATTTTTTTAAPVTEEAEVAKNEEGEVEAVTAEEEAPTEATRPPLTRFRPLRPALRTTTTTTPEPEAS